jgi:hypothetical protein
VINPREGRRLAIDSARDTWFVRRMTEQTGDMLATGLPDSDTVRRTGVGRDVRACIVTPTVRT